MFLITVLATARFFLLFFFNDTATTEIYTLSLHDALPIYLACSVKLDDIHALHAQRANTSAEFEDDRVVANKLPLIGKVLQNACNAAQVQHHCGLAFFWLPEDRRAEEYVIGQSLGQCLHILPFLTVKSVTICVTIR